MVLTNLTLYQPIYIFSVADSPDQTIHDISNTTQHFISNSSTPKLAQQT